MKQLFVPEDSEKYIEKLSELERTFFKESENMLIFSADNELRCVMRDSNIKDLAFQNCSLQLCKRDELIYSMELFENELYISGGVKIEILSDGLFLTTKCPRKTYCLKDHEGHLLFGGEDGISKPSKSLVYERYESITHAIEIHNEVLYDSGGYGVYETSLGKQITKRLYTSLCSYNGTLYGGSTNGVYDVLSDEKKVERPGYVRGLCIHDQELYDIGDYDSIYKTLNGESIFAFPNYEIRNSIISVPKTTFFKKS